MSQLNLFNEENEIEKEWKDMPEFKQENLQPYQSLIIHFETLEDRREFEKLIQQKITDRTKSTWFPKNRKEKSAEFKYINNE